MAIFAEAVRGAHRTDIAAWRLVVAASTAPLYNEEMAVQMVPCMRHRSHSLAVLELHLASAAPWLRDIDGSQRPDKLLSVPAVLVPWRR